MTRAGTPRAEAGAALPFGGPGDRAAPTLPAGFGVVIDPGS